jgi:hypothetical protein
MPAQISRALYPPDRQLIGAERHLKVTDWQAEYDRLREDPREVEAGLSANLNENAL